MARDAKGRDLPAPVRYSSTVVESVRAKKEPFVTVDAEDPKSSQLGQSILDLRLLSIMAVPLPVKGASLGVLYVDSTLQAREFTKTDLQVFRTLGGLIALALENGRLLEERVEKERMSRDIAMARTIQEGLFPKDLAMPAGFDVAAEARPAEETSGDYYDLVRCGAGRVAVVMGDVTGHGLAPALMMASTRAMLHALLDACSEPLPVIRSLNGFLHRDLPSHAFVSLFLGLLDPATREFRWANAGHNPPLWIRASGEVRELEGTGPVLGILPDVPYREAGPITLGAHDVVVLYTDGVTEARDDAGAVYGEERFLASLRRRCGQGRSAKAILDGILADLTAFTGTRPRDDDVTCLVLLAG
jgi:serine phosphatase RsbU (regulator of sigma subunit)